MSVTEGQMAWGSFEVPLLENTPRSIIRTLDESWYGLVRVFPQRVGPGQVDALAGLFTGVLLERPDRYTVGGSSATWFLGEASDGTGDDEVGPLTVSSITKNGTSNGALEGWMENILLDTDCGITLGDVGGPSSATKYAGTFTRRTPKTMLDSWVCPRFGVVYRVNPDLTLDIGYVADLYPPLTKPSLAVRRGGRDLNVEAVNAAELSMTQSVRDQASRVISVISDPATYQAVYPGSWPYLNPLGDPLNWTYQQSGTSSSQDDVGAANGEALADAGAKLAELGATQRTISISSVEYAFTDRIHVGEILNVFDLDDGLFDLAHKVQYRGKVIYPVPLRVQEITWPLQSGMSVWLDNRHQGGGLTDVTRYVDFTGESGDTQVLVGAPPSTVGKRLSRRRR